jgi:hypothetical protein
MVDLSFGRQNLADWILNESQKDKIVFDSRPSICYTSLKFWRSAGVPFIEGGYMVSGKK